MSARRGADTAAANSNVAAVTAACDWAINAAKASAWPAAERWTTPAAGWVISDNVESPAPDAPGSAGADKSEMRSFVALQAMAEAGALVDGALSVHLGGQTGAANDMDRQSGGGQRRG